MSKIPRIVLIGHVCIDHNKSEHATYTGWGSSVLYMAQYYQRQHGLSPTVITCYGPDMLAYLPDVSVLPAQPDQTKTLLYENDTSTGTRVQTCYNQVQAPPPTISPEVIAVLQQADIVVVATLLPNYSATYLRALLQHVDAQTLRVLCPQGFFRDISTEGRVRPGTFTEAVAIVPTFDLVLYSEEDHPQAIALAKEWKHVAPKTHIIVTQAANGASIVDASTVIHVPTRPIPPEEIIDSVGCGDTFAATVAYAYYQTKNLQGAIRSGHQAAAQKLLAVTVEKK